MAREGGHHRDRPIRIAAAASMNDVRGRRAAADKTVALTLSRVSGGGGGLVNGGGGGVAAVAELGLCCGFGGRKSVEDALAMACDIHTEIVPVMTHRKTQRMRTTVLVLTPIPAFTHRVLSRFISVETGHFAGIPDLSRVMERPEPFFLSLTSMQRWVVGSA